MTTLEQFEVLEAFKNKKEVYVKYKSLSHIDNWKLVTEGHKFNFDNNIYCIGKPLTFAEILAKEPNNIAFSKSLWALEDKGFFFDCTDSFGQHFKGMRVANLYRLWNIAVEYGRKTSLELTEITAEENGKLFKEFV